MNSMNTKAFRPGTFSVAALVFSLVFQMSHGATIGYYRFETENGAAVTNKQPAFRRDDSSGAGNHLIHATLKAANGTNYYVAFAGDSPFPSRVPRTGEANKFHLGNPPNNIDLARNALGMVRTNFTGLYGKEKLTFEMFLRRNSGDGGGDRQLFEVSNNPQTGNGQWYQVVTKMSNAAVVASINRFSLTVPGYGTVNTPYFADIYSKSRHFALTIEYTGNVKADYKFYLDGICMLTTNYFFKPSAAAAVPFSIACRFTGDTGPFTGIIDEFRISDTALPPEQFLGHFVPRGTALMVR